MVSESGKCMIIDHTYYGLETICTFLVSCGPSDIPWYGVSGFKHVLNSNMASGW